MLVFHYNFEISGDKNGFWLRNSGTIEENDYSRGGS